MSGSALDFLVITIIALALRAPDHPIGGADMPVVISIAELLFRWAAAGIASRLETRR